MRCIVPGCTSGYNSNHEKDHFFTVSKDKKRRKAWQIAIKRPDLVLECAQGLREYHFEKDDIHRERKLLGPDGTVLGVSTYKIPRLKEEAIPSLFPWTENVMENEQIAVDSQKTLLQTIKEKLDAAITHEDWKT